MAIAAVGEAWLPSEEYCLGALLLDFPSAWPAVKDKLTPAHFQRPDHQIIFSIIAELAANGAEAECFAVESILSQRGKLKDVGGLAYIAKLQADQGGVSNIAYHVGRLQEFYQRRAILTLSDEVVRSLNHGANAAQVVQALLPTLTELHRQQSKPQAPVAPLDWLGLELQDPPVMDWVIPHWIPAGHITLLSGRGGIGKTLLAQHLATAIAAGRTYLESICARNVLMWAAEDDHDELWRRQIPICQTLGAPMGELQDKLKLYSYCGQDVTLVAQAFGALQPTPMLAVLREQVLDLGARVVIIDNSARVFGGDENNRHHVTTFLALLQGACAPAAVILLSHPSKSEGSEYSGNTAWEGGVRSRLYLTDKNPVVDVSADSGEPDDPDVRWLARRKANYSARDVVKIALRDGALIPQCIAGPRRLPTGIALLDIVRSAVRTLAQRSIFGTSSPSSPNFLPKLAAQYGLLDGSSQQSFAAGMRQLQMAGELVSQQVGTYPNRTPKMGLILV